MKSKNKKMYSIVLAFMLLFNSFNSVIADDVTYDFTNREEYYKTYCNIDLSTMSKNDQDVCLKFKTYLEDKIKLNQLEIEAKNNEFQDLKIQVNEILPRLEQLNTEKSLLESQIASLTKVTDGIDAEIYALTKQIIVANEKIFNAEKEKRQMLPVSILDKAGLSRFTELEKDINEQQIKVQQLQAERNAKGDSFKEFESIVSDIETEKEKLIIVEAELKPLIAEFKEKEAEIMSLANTFLIDNELTKNTLLRITDSLGSITNSVSFVSPVLAGSYIQSAGSWFYPESFGGGLHLGVDCAAPIGTNVVAPANGVILYTANSCEDNGYLGNTCGYPGTILGGNQVHVAVSVNNTVYAISFSHLQSDSISVKTGDVVKQGELIGSIGLSGNTTGSHVHVAMVKIGQVALQEFVQEWNQDLSFGTGYGSAGYENRCTGSKSTNCRVRPEEYLPF